jgi:predicted DNA-binding protein YlxM (UPF0122 family)
MGKINFTTNQENEILTHYKNNVSSATIARMFGVSKTPILRILKQYNVIKTKDGNKKITLTEEQKSKIKELYLNGNKNTHQISKEVGLGSSFVDKYLNMVGYRRSKSEAMKIIKTGKPLPKDVIEKLIKIQREISNSGRRKQTGGVCKFYNIQGIICQGTYEKYYIEKLINDNIELPTNGDQILTPYGVYNPDFKKDGRYIEIKSDYTYDILIGKKKSRFTNKKETTQMDKIKWVNENYLPVDIIVVDKRKNKLIKKNK